MIVHALILLMLAGAFLSDGRRDGRRGNQAYERGEYAAAADAYRQGLAEADEDERFRFALLNNLGAAEYRLENVEDALRVFDEAADLAGTPEAVAKAAYNAGNASFRTGDLERALGQYRRALMADPTDEDAKFNYEFVKRQLEQQDEQDQQQQDGESEGDDEQQPDEGQDQDEGQQGEGQQDEGEEQDEGQPDEGQEQDDGDQAESEQQQGEGQEPRDQSDEEGGAQPHSPELTREQAERILQALEGDEAELLRERQRMEGPPRRVEKDW